MRRFYPRLSFVLLVTVAGAFELNVLHTNDVHARFDEMSKYGGTCAAEDKATGNCYGGMPRLKTKITELRAKYPNTLLVDGGDYFQGTIWFYLYKGYAASHFMNIMKYDAMAVGNHEFDNGPEVTASFAKNISFPLLSCNMVFSEDEKNLKNLVKRSVIKEVGGEKIGILGFTTEETVEISQTGPDISFEELVSSVRKEAQKLTSQGVNKIIAIGHAGLRMDETIAMEVPEVDIVVGGHTDTFLYTGKAPSVEKPVSTYPITLNRTDGTIGLVVQDYTFAKYIGHLQVTFNNDGQIIAYSGNPILLDKSVIPDAQVQAEIDQWNKPLQAMQNYEIGKSFVHLDGSKVACRQRECNLGNLIADALVHQNLARADSLKWSDVPIAIVNSGAIRTSLAKGRISVASIMSIMPFRNTVDIIQMTGETLKKILEHGVTQYHDIPGRFLQFSGLRVWYDMSRPEGSRVVRVLTRCYDCQMPRYNPLNETRSYRVLLTQYMINGGDGYTMIAEEQINRHIIGQLDTEIIMEYVIRVQPLAIGVEGRINFIENSTNSCIF